MASLWRYDVPIANQSFFDGAGGLTALAHSVSFQPIGNDEFIIQADQLIDVGAECKFYMNVAVLVTWNGIVSVRFRDLTNSRTLCQVSTDIVGFSQLVGELPINYYATPSGDIRARFEYTSSVPAANGVAGIGYAYVKLKRR